ncbi:MAG TPA: outer membrane beta-barrel protein [Luteibaculaceae bacterium]|nr:outer membrane beta-barrel protein [Luteibaculaceae bacterium]
MKKFRIFLSLAILSLGFVEAKAQYAVKGMLLDTKGAALPFATVALLNPTDSTMAFFAISNDQGLFEMKNTKAGDYLLQTAYLGFKPVYKRLTIAKDTQLDAIVMQPDDRDLKTVEIEGERVPIMIKGDTIEYNAGAFKTKPDANVEELLKKMPGIEVDRAGNVKAQGEDVKRILVDGKEFFSNDQKIATKNIPADAIKKVQVFDKTSDQADFTGIDDGNRDKTINLMLKDDKKNGLFGDVSGGVGTDNRYQAAAKVYNFTPTRQMAALGMVNNINQFGFSLNDYINFKGGIGSLLNGGGLQLNSTSSLPVNFGQPINGLIRSAAGGVNFNYEPVKNRRFNISYLGSSTKTTLNEDQYTENFTENQRFIRNRTSADQTTENGHGFTTSYRGDLDSNQQVTANASVNFGNGRAFSKAQTMSLLENIALNQLDNSTQSSSNNLNGTGSLSYTLKAGKSIPVIRLTANAGFSNDLDKNNWLNTTNFFNPNTSFTDNQYQNNTSDRLNYGLQSSTTAKMGRGYFADLILGVNANDDRYQRTQGLLPGEGNTVDSLEVDFTRQVTAFSPGIAIKRNSDKTQFTATLSAESGSIKGRLFDQTTTESKYLYFLPRLRFNREYASGKRYGFQFDSRVNTPQTTQLQPVVNTINPLSLFQGNPNLRPEVNYNSNINWVWFDQFSFTSIFASIRADYTRNKINLARTINPNLSQSVQYVNVDYQAGGSVNLEFSTPIRKLGVNVELSLEESLNRTLAPVNGIINVNDNLTHGAEISFKKRKADKLSLSFGGSLRYTDAKYSLQAQLNNSFYTLSYFTEANYSPTDKWNFNFIADVSSYQSDQFSQNIQIPLLQAEVSYFFLKANRASVSIKGFDLLNMNTGLQRVSELNYLQQTQSNVIGRYAMLTFKYKLSKVGAASGGNMDIKIKNR